MAVFLRQLRKCTLSLADFENSQGNAHFPWRSSKRAKENVHFLSFVLSCQGNLAFAWLLCCTANESMHFLGCFV
jgi:hypothetical protein